MAILILDDNRDIAESLSLAFEALDLESIVTTRGQDALAAIEKHRPHSAILDLCVPEIDGYRVATAFRHSPLAEVCSATLIAYTAEMPDDVRLKQAGFDYFVSKPSDPAYLAACCLGFSNLPSPLKLEVPKIDYHKLDAISTRSAQLIRQSRELAEMSRHLRRR